MNLPKEQEERLMIQYDPYIKKCVNAFVRKGNPKAMDNRKDFEQEARLAFLIHLRKIDDISMISQCWLEMTDAMRAYCKLMAPIHMPRKKYLKNRKMISILHCDIGDMEQTSRILSDDHVYGEVEVNDFISRLSESEQTILRMKAERCTNLAIMPFVNARNESHMSRLVSRLRDKVRICFFEA